jgi:hypothetical protein
MSAGRRVVNSEETREAGGSIEPRVALAKPRSTLGFMLSPASRAANIFFVRDPRVALAKPRSTLGFMLPPASRAANAANDGIRSLSVQVNWRECMTSPTLTARARTFGSTWKRVSPEYIHRLRRLHRFKKESQYGGLVGIKICVIGIICGKI